MSAGKSEDGAVFLRLTLANGGRIGPGKVALIEAIDRTGSIAGAGRALGMSYRRAWRLVDAINALTDHTMIETQQGGAAGGGARVTDRGRRLVQRYRDLEARTANAARPLLDGLD